MKREPTVGEKSHIDKAVTKANDLGLSIGGVFQGS